MQNFAHSNKILKKYFPKIILTTGLIMLRDVLGGSTEKLNCLHGNFYTLWKDANILNSSMKRKEQSNYLKCL